MTLWSNHVIAKTHVTNHVIAMISRDYPMTLKEKIWTSGRLTELNETVKNLTFKRPLCQSHPNVADSKNYL